jgi:hypothetical protein
MSKDYKNEIKTEYQENKDGLQASFAEAYDFLVWLEGLESEGYHLGTDVNLHFYYQNSFLFRIEFVASSQIDILQKSLRGKVKDGTTDRGEVFFDYWHSHLKRVMTGAKISNRVKLNKKDDLELYFKTLRNAVKNVHGELDRKGYI